MSRKLLVPLLCSPALAGLVLFHAEIASSVDAFMAKDPGVRAGAGTGDSLPNLTPTQLEFFNMGKVSFVEAEAVADGLGPRMNLDNCGGCHSQPGFGGTRPPQ